LEKKKKRVGSYRVTHVDPNFDENDNKITLEKKNSYLPKSHHTYSYECITTNKYIVSNLQNIANIIYKTYGNKLLIGLAPNLPYD